MSIMEIVVMALLAALAGQSPAPASSVREFVSLSGTVEQVERSTRTLTLRTSSSTTQTIDVPPELKLFDELRTGDKITVRISEEVIVAVRPGAKPSEAVDTTGTATSRDSSGKNDVLQQLKATVKIDSVDRRQNVIVYTTGLNLRVTRAVADPRLLDGLKAGDVVEVTYTRERAVDVQRTR
jgi:hypothetical protein